MKKKKLPMPARPPLLNGEAPKTKIVPLETIEAWSLRRSAELVKQREQELHLVLMGIEKLKDNLRRKYGTFPKANIDVQAGTIEV